MAISLGGMVLVKSKTLVLEIGERAEIPDSVWKIRDTVSKIFNSADAVCEWQKSQTLSGKFEPMLSWSHYCELLKVDEPLARAEAGGSIKDVVESEKEQLCNSIMVASIRNQNCFICSDARVLLNTSASHLDCRHKYLSLRPFLYILL